MAGALFAGLDAVVGVLLAVLELLLDPPHAVRPSATTALLTARAELLRM